MKYLATTLMLILCGSVMSQIKFSDKTFDNGMRYPVAHYSKNPTVADTMNAIIQRNLMDAEVSDFCVGDYGLVQKGNHVELHLVCNCIDFAETDHRYLFFSLETGQLVDYSDLFDPKEKAKGLTRINELVSDAGDDTCKAELISNGENLNWSDMTIRLYKEGLEIHPKAGKCNNPVKVPWTEVSTYLKYNFL
ncbi:MAG: hypothetical protein NXI10_08640 [bacterium]|nr:hypothetical protein [bacterium]